MSFLFLSIISSTSIPIVFKIMEKQDIPLVFPIVINYLTAGLLGFFLTPGPGKALFTADLFTVPWFFMAGIIGMLLIALFFIIGLSTRRAGITPTTIAGKMSVIIPIVFSIVWFGEDMNLFKLGGILSGLFSVFLIAAKKENTAAHGNPFSLPLVLFIGAGVLDALIKLTQQKFLSSETSAVFTGTCFFFAFAAGVAVCFFQKTGAREFFRPKTLLAGLVLGCVNFGSIFFLIRTLENGMLAASVLFGLNSIGIVCLSVFTAAALFKERLSKANWIGVGLAVTAVLSFTHA